MASILDLINEYPQVDKSILKQYREPENIVTVNVGDMDLCPIDIDIEKLIRKNFSMMHPGKEFPAEDLLLGYDHKQWHKIQNFGLPAREQKWSPPKMPERLRKLERTCETLDEIYQILNDNKENYISEIKWVKSMWHKRLYGHWVFINGVPTYLDGWNFFYCGFWELDIGLPAYRSRDRKFFLFARYCYTTTEAPFKYRRKVGKNYQYTSDKKDFKQWYLDYEETKRSKPEEAKDFFWKDYNTRTCYGFNYPKHRREGATFKGECINYELISRTLNSKAGIQSMDDTHGKAAFLDKLVAPWKSLPFFFKPKFSGSTNPKSELIFEEPTRKSKNKGTMNVTRSGLGSKIDFATTAARGFYDGDKLLSIHTDEEGKTTLELVDERWAVLRQCLSMGNGKKIIGFNVSTSTVGEMTKKGGTAYFKLCKDSHWQNRVPESGQTSSGKFNLFIPAYDGLEGFIDEFGNSIIEDPETPIRTTDGSYVEIGSKTFLKGRSRELLGEGKPENIEKYHENMRQNPTKFKECFMASASDTGFNIKILSERINELQMNERLQPVMGDFVWEVKWESVKWIPNPYGKFAVSLSHLGGLENRIRIVDGVKCPANPNKFVASGDAFRFEKTQHRRMSNGAGAVFYKRDYTADPEGKEPITIDEAGNRINNWKSHRFCCTYNNRVATKIEYAEDMLMMCVYYGAMMYPEMNVPDINDKFNEWGFGGYLLYDFDPIQNIFKVNPGFSSLGVSKQDLFGGLKEYIEVHGYRETHLDLLEECLSIRGLEDMTDYDVFTAGAGAMRGVKSQYADYMDNILGNNPDNQNAVEWGDIMFG